MSAWPAIWTTAAARAAELVSVSCQTADHLSGTATGRHAQRCHQGSRGRVGGHAASHNATHCVAERSSTSSCVTIDETVAFAFAQYIATSVAGRICEPLTRRAVPA